MIGVLLSAIGAFFEEISTSIGKVSIAKKKEGLYTLGFLNNFWSLIGFLIIILVRRDFVFSLWSLPTFALRAMLEIVLVYSYWIAICHSDRSTFGFIRIITLPVLLMVDLFLGYSINNWQVFGIAIIFFTLLLVLASKGINKKGAFYALLPSLIAVATISLYKYDITHFNSVTAEQSITVAILAGFFYFMSRINGESPFKYMFKPIIFSQSISVGISVVIISFAYKFAPASVVSSAYRSSAILWSIVSGKLYFHEKSFLIKLICMFLLVFGIIFLII